MAVKVSELRNIPGTGQSTWSNRNSLEMSRALTTVFQDSSLARFSVFFLILIGAAESMVGFVSVLWSNFLQEPTPFSIQHLDLLAPRSGIYFALGTLIEPNILGSFLLAPFAMALWLGWEENSRAVKVAAYLMLAGIVVTGTRAAWIASSGIYLVWILQRAKKSRPILPAAGVVLLAILVLAAPAIRLEISRGTFGWRSLPRGVLAVLTKNFAYAAPRNQSEFFKFGEQEKKQEKKQEPASGFLERAVDETEGSG